MIRLCVEECRATVCTFNDNKRDANQWLMNLKLTGTKSVDSDGAYSSILFFTLTYSFLIKGIYQMCA